MTRIATFIIAAALALAPAQAKMIINSYTSGCGDDFSLAHVANYEGNLSAGSFTVSGASLGAESCSRRIIVGVGAGGAPGSASVTIGGETATKHVETGNVVVTTFFSLEYLEGATANIVVTTSSGNTINLSIWRLTGAGAAPYATASDGTPSSKAFSASLAIPSGGAGIGFAAKQGGFFGGAGTWSWTNLTETFEIPALALFNFSSSGAYSASPGTATRTATNTGSVNSGALVLMSWAPE